MRLVTESDADWYGAAYSAPATLELQAGPAGHASTWTSATRAASPGRARRETPVRARLPLADRRRHRRARRAARRGRPAARRRARRDDPPRSRWSTCPTCPPATYRLDWGMLQRDVAAVLRARLGRRRDASSRSTAAAANAAAVAMPATLPRDDDEAPWVVGRLDLWGAARADDRGPPAARRRPGQLPPPLRRRARPRHLGRARPGQQPVSRAAGRPRRRSAWPLSPG